MYCPYNNALDCEDIKHNDKACEKCGWNPTVCEERKKKIREDIEEDIEKECP